MLMSVLLLAGFFGGGLVILAVSIFVMYTVYLSYIHYKYSHIPSPKRSSFYSGHMADYTHLKKVTGNPEPSLATLINYWAEDLKTTTFVVFFFHVSRIVTLDPEVIKTIIMNTKNSKPRDVASFIHTVFGERFLGDGLVTEIDHNLWKPRRKIYDPAFKKSYLKTLVSSFNESADHFLKKMEPLADGKTVVPLNNHIMDFTLDTISQAGFGTDFSKMWDAKSLDIISPVDESENILVYITKKALMGIQFSLRAIYPPFNQYLHPFEARGYQEAVRAMRKIGRDCIMKRIKTIENGEQPPNDILTHILKVASTTSSTETETVSVETLLDDFCTYYVAGTETTSSLLSFATYLLHEHPGSLQRLVTEVNDVLGDRTYVTAEDLEKLQYTEQVLHETLRLYPPVFGLFRTLHSKSNLGGYSIPANSQIMMSTATMCRMPQYFEDPDVFNPSRFAPGNEKPSSFVFYPFGVGHRSCIGQNFAMTEAKILLTRLFQSYKFSFAEDFQLMAVQRTTLQPKDLPCTLTKN